MQFKSTIVVNQPIELVWEFLANPLNSPKWDRSIGKIIIPETGFTGKDCIIMTVSPSGMKQSFIVTDFEPPRFFKFKLLQSNMFKDAHLSFLMKTVGNKTQIIHEITIKLFTKAFFLYPVLLLTQKKALKRDMEYLKAALNDVGVH